MLKFLIALFLTAPVAAQAFSKCDVAPLGGPGAVIAEEGSDPVAAGEWAYAGYTRDTKVVVETATNGGAILNAPQTVYDQRGESKHLRIAASGKNVYLVWQHRVGADKHLMFAASAKHGMSGTWRAPVDLGQTGGLLQQISADGDNVHIVYLQQSDMAAVVSSKDGGLTFGAPVPIDFSAGEVVVASRGRDVYAAWEVTKDLARRGVDFAVSHDGGETFEFRNLSENGFRVAREPILSVNPGSGRLSLVWREDRPVQGVYLQSTDGGRTFSAPLPIDDPARQFMVQDDGDFIYISYLKQFDLDGTADWQIYLTYSADGGKTFPSKTNLSGPTGITEIKGDNDRPVLWAATGKIRLTGVTENGVYIWSGNSGRLHESVYLGPGTLASPQKDVAAWLAPNGVATFAYCHAD